MRYSFILPLLFLAATPAGAQDATAKFTRAEAPVLTRAKHNTVLEIRLDNPDSGPPVMTTVEKIAITLDGTTDLGDIESVGIIYESRDKKQHSFGKELAPAPGEMIFQGRQAARLALSAGVFKVNIRLKPSAGLLNRVNASCAWLHAGGKRIDGAAMPAPGLRIGVAVRQAGDDGVVQYRIPGIVTTPKGTLLAIYDMRRDVPHDLQGNIDIGLSRSTDGGQTWEPMRVVLDMGEWGGLPQKYNGVADACILADARSGAVFVTGLWMHGVLDNRGRPIGGLTASSTSWNHQWLWDASQPGFDVKNTSQFLLATSLDDGQTWAEPVNMTRQLKKPEWRLFAPTPGRGITLRDGTLVFPTHGINGSYREFTNITWSKDGGKTWTVSEPALFGSVESQVAQLDDGSIMINTRQRRDASNSANHGRLISVTRDLGKTWTEHPASRGTLIEPRCFASLWRHEYTAPDGSKKSVLLFSNPNSKGVRENLTIKASFDNGETWPESHWILLNEERNSAYSCLTSIDERTIGIFYEVYDGKIRSDLILQKIPLSDILGKVKN